jgi:2-amino-4-hydroxy-6-hydroxymethyldihydropteridine diphosphokinase
MNKAFLSIGGNQGDMKSNLATAVRLISERCGEIEKISSLYETEAWGNKEQPGFLNQAIQLSTELNAMQLMRRLLKIEKSMGRKREEKYGPRIIDIDIIFFNDDIINYSFLKVPHPEMQNRRFVLVPLEEIAADMMHPVLKLTVKELLDKCPDHLEVKILT